MRLAFRFFERPPELQSLLFLLLFGLGERFPRFCVFVVAIGHVTMAVAVCRVCMVFSTVAMSRTCMVFSTVAMAVTVTMHFVMQLVLEVDSMIVVARLLIIDSFKVLDFKLGDIKLPFSGSSL